MNTTTVTFLPQAWINDYYATIITDGRPPDSVIVWNSGGFYLK